MGDAWDLLVTLPETPVPVQPRPVRKRRKSRRSRPDEVILKEFHPTLHPVVIVIWVVIALGVFSTGPAYPLMPLWGLVAVFAGVGGFWFLRRADVAVTGQRHCLSGSIAGLLLILIDAFSPDAAPYNSWFVQSHGSTARALTFEEKMEYVEAYMPLMAKAAMCGHLHLQDEITAVGRDGMNREVRNGSSYFRISTLRRIDRESASITPDMLVYAPGNTPPDPFADDSRATFGVYVTEFFVLVYSIGPDGEWQINPRKPVDGNSRNPKGELRDHIYDRVQGTVGKGDILKVYRLETEEGLSFFCDDVRQEFEAFGRGERIKVE